MDMKSIITRNAKRRVIKITVPCAGGQESALVSSSKSAKIDSPIPEVVPTIRGSSEMNSLLNSKFYPQYEELYLQVQDDVQALIIDGVAAYQFNFIDQK